MTCKYCHTECWNQEFVPGRGWESSHPKCRPFQPRVERRYARGHIVQSYGGIGQGENYPGERETKPSEAMHRAILSQRQRNG